MKPRSAKAKGTRLEAWTAAALSALGVPARRQPGSGVYADFPADVRAEIGGTEYVIECKSWRHGWRTGDAALGKADLLIIRRDRGEPAAYLPWAAFARLVAAANSGHSLGPSAPTASSGAGNGASDASGAAPPPTPLNDLFPPPAAQEPPR